MMPGRNSNHDRNRDSRLSPSERRSRAHDAYIMDAHTITRIVEATGAARVRDIGLRKELESTRRAAISWQHKVTQVLVATMKAAAAVVPAPKLPPKFKRL